MKIFGICAALAMLASPAAADFLSPNNVDESRSFKVEGQLRYLLGRGYGISSVSVRTSHLRTAVVIGVDDEVNANFSDLMWDAAARVSLMTGNMVTLVVHKQNLISLGERYCWLRARKGRVFDGTC